MDIRPIRQISSLLTDWLPAMRGELSPHEAFTRRGRTDIKSSLLRGLFVLFPCDFRYQHAESYLTPVSASAPSTTEVREEVAHRAILTKDSEGKHDTGKVKSSGKGLPTVGTEAQSTGSTTTASTDVPRWELPAINFEAGDDGGSEGRRRKRQETAAKRSTWFGEGESPARGGLATAADETGENFDEGGDVTGAPGSVGRRSSSSDRETEDFLALETGMVPASGESLGDRSYVSTNEVINEVIYSL